MDVCWVGGKGHTWKYTTFLFSDDSRPINPVPSQTQHTKSTATVLSGSLVLSAGLGYAGYAVGEPMAPRALTGQPATVYQEGLADGGQLPRPSIVRLPSHDDHDQDQG